MIKYIFTAIIIANFGFCKPDCGNQIPIESSFPEDVTEKVPYQNNQSVTFKHSLGQEINYTVYRNSGREEDSQCDECCTQISYDFDETYLEPDYPIFAMQVNLSSYDSAQYTYTIRAGNSFFNLNVEERYQQVDSIKVGEQYFKDVYKIKSRNQPNTQGIYPDSVYYNFSTGFLKIIMSNEEYYEIQ